MFVELGDRMPVEDLIRGIIIQSGNDACIVVAEGMGGTVEGFVDHDEQARQGAGPDPIAFRQSRRTARSSGPADVGAGSRQAGAPPDPRLSDYYHYFSEQQIRSGSNITQPNRDLVLDKLPGADGLKTGHTDAAGYGITTSAKRGDQRLILVLNGLRYPDLDKSISARQDCHGPAPRDEAARVLDIAFREFRRYPLFKPGDVVGQADVWGGTENSGSADRRGACRAHAAGGFASRA